MYLLLDMTVSAEVIVKGRYTAVPDTVNGIVTTRTVNNSDKTQKSLLNTYRFEIEEIIKGKTSDKTIYINHHYSDTVYVYEEDGSGRVVGTVEVINPLFVEPKEDQSVIVFLSSTALEREYEGATEPFIVGVNDKDELTLYSNGLNEKNTSETFQTYRLKEGYRLSIEMPDFNFEDTVTGKCVSDIVTIIKANQLN
ncbi:hypothetical protein [Alkalibacterium sp. MB6]|uniref:hypothetical protein n=1 Tax=Alkalibacterium sp. MB6 TaxID=2081965 RepID=UPI00137B89BE|nr:hypothetical protein [Alkalibacterium sp. MB6]